MRETERAARREEAHQASRRFTPLRAAGTLAAVCALIAGVAIPAYAATQQDTSSQTASVREAAEGEAQSLEVSEDAASTDLTATTYAATSSEEIEKIEAERAALERAEAEQAAAEEAAAEAAASAEATEAAETTGTVASAEAPAPTVVDGAVNPLPAGSYYVSRSVSSGHDGTDMVAPAMTPIYAVKSGTVTVSSEGYGGWGVTVAIDHNDGTQTLYGHMTYGTRQVAAGQAVEAGQIIGYVGSTGRSTANHLHIELRINGVIVDPMNYLPI
ncbi:M23 family metallopeptidase [Microbacterium sp. CBS5P-1]|nr:M23 family metallopeptidase [Microbacterium excoecariae]